MKTICILTLCAVSLSCTNPTHWNWAAVYSMKKSERQENNEWKRFAEAYSRHLEQKDTKP